MAEPESNGKKPRTPEEEQAIRDEARRQAAGIEFMFGGKRPIDPALRPEGARRAIEAIVTTWPEVRTLIDSARRLGVIGAAEEALKAAGFDEGNLYLAVLDEKSAIRGEYIEAVRALERRGVVFGRPDGLLMALAALHRAASDEEPGASFDRRTA